MGAVKVTSVELNKEKIKKLFIELIKEDNEVKDILADILSTDLATKKDIIDLTIAIKNLREDFNREMIALRKDMREEFDRVWDEIKSLREEMAQMRKDMREEFSKVWDEIKSLREETKALREDLSKAIKDLHRHLSAIGNRFGRGMEEAFRNAMMDLVEKAVGSKVTSWRTFDDKGIVYGEPSEIEIDLAIVNKKHILVEIKSRVKKSDVTELLRIAEVYKEKEKVEPELAIVAGIIDENALEFAKRKGISVYTYEPPKY